MVLCSVSRVTNRFLNQHGWLVRRLVGLVVERDLLGFLMSGYLLWRGDDDTLPGFDLTYFKAGQYKGIIIVDLDTSVVLSSYHITHTRILWLARA